MVDGATAALRRTYGVPESVRLVVEEGRVLASVEGAEEAVRAVAQGPDALPSGRGLAGLDQFLPQRPCTQPPQRFECDVTIAQVLRRHAEQDHTRRQEMHADNARALAIIEHERMRLRAMHDGITSRPAHGVLGTRKRPDRIVEQIEDDIGASAR